jgi:hypothetical protein
MAKCPECGFENPPNLDTCLNCGASLKREKLGQAIDDISEDATIMIGHPLRVSAPPPPPSSTGKPTQPAGPVAQAPPAPADPRPAAPPAHKPTPPPAPAHPNTLLYIIIAAASTVATLVVVLILKIIGVF